MNKFFMTPTADCCCYNNCTCGDCNAIRCVHSSRCGPFKKEANVYKVIFTCFETSNGWGSKYNKVSFILEGHSVAKVKKEAQLIKPSNYIIKSIKKVFRKDFDI